MPESGTTLGITPPPDPTQVSPKTPDMEPTIQKDPAPATQTVSDDLVNKFLSLDKGKRQEAIGKLSDPTKRALIKAVKARSSVISKPPEPLSAPARFAGSFTEAASGMPGDLRQWPKAIHDLTMGPIPKGSVIDPTGGALNPAINLAKGIFTASGDAAKIGMERMKQPGWENKLIGGMQYIESGIPVLGPSTVKAGEQFEKGDYAGGFGTMTGMALQILSGSPELRGVAAEKLSKVPENVASGTQNVVRHLSGVSDKVIETAQKQWAKDTLEAQAKHETKVAEILADNKENTFDAWLQQAEKVKDQNVAHAKKIAEINEEHATKMAEHADKVADKTAKHAESVSKVRAENERSKAEVERGLDSDKAANQIASTVSDDLQSLEKTEHDKASTAFNDLKIKGGADIGELHQSLQESIESKLKGAGSVPSSLAKIMDELAKPGEGLTPPDPTDFKSHAEYIDSLTKARFDKLQGYRSEIGRQMYEVEGDNKALLTDVYGKLTKEMEKLADAENKGPQLKAANRGWQVYSDTFRNTDPPNKGGSPIARALRARDTVSGKMRPNYVREILSDPNDNVTAQEVLERYEGTDKLRESLDALKNHSSTAKAAPKTVSLKAEPTLDLPEPPAALELPEKPEAPEPKLPSPPELPKSPEIEPFSEKEHRLKLMEETAKHLQKMTPWESRLWGLTLVEAFFARDSSLIPLTLVYPASRRIQSMIMNSEAFRMWVAGERPPTIWPRDTGGRFRAFSPLNPKQLSATPPSVTSPAAGTEDNRDESSQKMSPPPQGL